MKTFFLSLLILLALLSQVRAQSYTVSLTVSDKVEQAAVDAATMEETRALVECVVESGEAKLENTACVNDVLGDVH